MTATTNEPAISHELITSEPFVGSGLAIEFAAERQVRA